jgi:hypothetical protein
MTKQYPLKKQAEQLAARGRYGDTRLLHVNELELEGLASLVPGGLTTNPDTGQPEAFAFLIPLLASGIGSAAGLGTWGTAALSGAMTAAATGDLKRGALAAVTGGIAGTAFDAAAEAGAGAAADAATQAAAESAAAIPETTIPLLEQGNAAALEAAQSATSMVPGQVGVNIGDAAVQAPLRAMGPTTGATVGSAMPGAVPPNNTGFGTRLGNIFSKEGGKAFAGELSKQSKFVPFALGSGQIEQIGQQEQWDKAAKKLANERDAQGRSDLQRAYGNLQQGYAAAGHQPGLSPERMNMSNLMPMPNNYNKYGGRYAGGGMIKFNGRKMTMDQFRDMYANEFGYGANNGYGGIDPVTVQKNLRHTYTPAPAGYQHGFMGEHDFFQRPPDEEGIASLAPAASARSQNMPGPSMGGYNPNINRFVTGQSKKRIFTKEKADGGRINLDTAAGPMSVAAGGIANLPNPFTAARDAGSTMEPSVEDVKRLAMAVLRGGEGADVVIDQFIKMYGVDAFRTVREMILQSANGGPAQTEGMVKGPGGGMDDQVMGTIGDQEQVAVSPGEYIVPADVVSGLGDGSSDAGATELDNMSQRVRMARGGTTQQPPPFDATRVMPK